MERKSGFRIDFGFFRRLAERFAKREKTDAAAMKKEEELFRKMEYLVAFEGLYKKKHLSMIMLSREAGSNRSYVSAALRHKGLNFSCYLGSLRVQKVMQLLADEEFANMEAGRVADLCGFTSERTMNYYLNRMLGMTFTALRRRAVLLREGERRG